MSQRKCKEEECVQVHGSEGDSGGVGGQSRESGQGSLKMPEGRPGDSPEGRVPWTEVVGVC